MIDSYVALVSAHPFISAFIQFAILGTVGELVSFVMVHKRVGMPCTPLELFGKVIAWGVMGLVIKYGFVGMKGFTDGLLSHGLLPAFCSSGLGYAFSLSFLMQLFFGPQLMYFHRLEDNLILRKWDFGGMGTALRSLAWFWLPAHTLTFLLDKPYQIGLAACWSVVLGFILGFAKLKNDAK
jgi:hypothetical protein